MTSGACNMQQGDCVMTKLDLNYVSNPAFCFLSLSEWKDNLTESDIEEETDVGSE